MEEKFLEEIGNCVLIEIDEIAGVDFFYEGADFLNFSVISHLSEREHNRNNFLFDDVRRRAIARHFATILFFKNLKKPAARLGSTVFPSLDMIA